MKIFRILTLCVMAAIMCGSPVAVGAAEIDNILDALIRDAEARNPTPVAPAAPAARETISDASPIGPSVAAARAVISPNGRASIPEIRTVINSDRAPFKDFIAFLVRSGFRVELTDDVDLERAVTIQANNDLLSDVVSAVARSQGLHWDFRENRFYFSKKVWLTFRIPDFFESINYSRSVVSGSGSSSGGSSGGSGFGSASVASSAELKIEGQSSNVWTSVVSALRTALDQGGVAAGSNVQPAKVLPSPEAGLIVVEVDATQADLVRSFVTEVIRERLRVASVSFAIIEVRHDAGADFGSSLTYTPRSGPHGYIAGATHNSQNADIVSALTALNLRGRSWTGLLQAASNYGNSKLLFNHNSTLMNRVPTIVSRVQTIPFLYRVVTQTTGAAGNTISTPELGTAKVGITISMVASIMNEDQVLLSFLPSISDRVGQFSITIGGTQATQPSILERAMDGRLILNRGEASVIGGLRISQETLSSSGLPLLNVLGNNSADNSVADMILAVRVDDIASPDVQYSTDIRGSHDYQPSLSVR